MTQCISDKALDEARDDYRCVSIAEDLLSLRAAVRRVLEERRATRSQAVCMPLEVVHALDALDAEMASIDGGAS